MPATRSEIGPVYDLLLATRDGTTLPCRNKDGQTVNISSLAYMTSIDRNNQQHEETELQHKDQLIQLGSSNLSDREFNQWPQVSQGDWSGGMLQKILTGSTPVTSFSPQSDPTRYWDGDAVLWPVSESVPQRGAVFPPVQDAGGAVMKAVFNAGTPAGFINSVGQSFAYLYQTQPAAHVNLVIQTNTIRNFVQDPPGITTGSGTPTSPQPPDDFFIGAGVLWYVAQSGAARGVYFVTVGSPTVTLFDSIAAVSPGPNCCSVGHLGNKVYLAVPCTLTTAPSIVIRLFDITTGLNSLSIDIPVGDSTTVLSSSSQITITQTGFVGASLYYSFTQGQDAALAAYDIPSGTVSVVARFPNEAAVQFAPTAAGVFVITTDGNMYLIQGGSVQNIGELPAQIGTQVTSASFRVFARPIAFGPYAIFASAARVIGLSTDSIAVYAYDVLRGRLFRMAAIGGFSGALSSGFGGNRIGILKLPTRTVSGVNYQPQWGVVVPALSAVGDSNDVSNAQELYMGVTPAGSVSALLTNGSVIVSSIIDFTSAQPKLYRQIVLTCLSPGLPSSSAITVQVDAWLDQDPTNLSAVPDFSTGAIGNGVNGGTLGQTTFKLLINKIARRLVYRITTTGGDVVVAGQLTSAVRLKDISVQAATGWTRTMMLDLADNANTNSKSPGETAWARQSILGQPAIDQVVAYNFLRQLWRLKGGEVTATFPNGDPPADWLLQDIHWDSPKPFGVSFRADQKSQLGYLATIKLSEDI